MNDASEDDCEEITRKKRRIVRLDSDQEESEQVNLPKKRRRVEISDEEILPAKTRKIESTGLTPGISALKINNPGKAASPFKTKPPVIAKEPAKAKVASPALKNERSNTFSIVESDILAAINDVDSDLLNGFTLVLSGIM